MSFSWMKFGLSGVFARNDSERFKNYSLFSNVFRDVSGLNRSFLVRSAEVSQYFFEILFWTETFRTHLALLKRLEVSGALWGRRASCLPEHGSQAGSLCPAAFGLEMQQSKRGVRQLPDAASITFC
jgi:hypothetical protein